MRNLFNRRILNVFVLTLMVSCGMQQKTPQVEGLYTYEHAFNYDLNGNHLDVQETGTMEFFSDSAALDSACQVYTATLKDGGTATFIFNYVSPSLWSLDGEDFYFSGVKESFRMELMEIKTDGCDSNNAAQLAQEIIRVVGGSIDYKYTFHLDSLTEQKLQWSYVYRDGHSDTWQFYRYAK